MRRIKRINEYHGTYGGSPEGFYYTKRISDGNIKFMRDLGISPNAFEKVYALFMEEITDENIVQTSFTDWLHNEDNYVDYLNK